MTLPLTRRSFVLGCGWGVLRLCGLHLWGRERSGSALAQTAPRPAAASKMTAPQTASASPMPASLPLYIGTYTQSAQGGLYGALFNAQTGQLGPAQLLAVTSNPSFLALARDGHTLYATNEWGQVAGENKGGLSAFRVEAPTQAEPIRLEELQAELLQALAIGGTLCHAVVDATGRWLLSAAYSEGSVSVWSLGADGRLGPRVAHQRHAKRTTAAQGPHAARQEAPHAHQVLFSPDNRCVFVPDLGLDQVLLYDFDDQTGRLTPATPAFIALPGGAGPRHGALSPSGQFLYIVSELNNTVTVFTDALGAPRAVQTVSTLPADFAGESFTAEIAVRPDGRFVYASNRGHNSIVCYAVGADGRLTLVGFAHTGRTPRHFTFDPSGRWLLVGNQQDHSITVFRTNATNGTLTEHSQLTGLPDEPVCLLWGSRQA